MSDEIKESIIDAIRDFKKHCVDSAKDIDIKNPTASLNEDNMKERMSLLAKVFALLDELDENV